jgi:acyl transferase domain-containing protein
MKTTNKMKPKVAIVGVGAKTPKGNGLEDLWEALIQNDSQIRTVCTGEGDQAFGYASLLPDEIRDSFDPKFWGMNPAQVCYHSRLFVNLIA